NPINHASSLEDADRYRVEPYVVAADIYSEGDLSGRGGWTWYTSSAGWLYRTAIEGILGIQVVEGHIHVKPALPSSWDHYAVTLTLSRKEYRIEVSRSSGDASYVVQINGQALETGQETYHIN
ncbi:hypothetical protein QT369_22530, partial [Xanthomonas citri pv. citri]